MPSITTWTRVEPQSRSDDVAGGVAARIHDPLWLLARQWQVAEFQGEDGGTPVVARWRGRVAPLSRCYLGAITPDTRVQAAAFDPASLPLETMVERQPLPQGIAATPSADGLRRAVDAGQYFLRLLALQPVLGRYREAFITAYAVPALDAGQRAGLDPDTLAFADLVAGRALDGRRLRAAFDAGGVAALAPTLQIRPTDRAEVQNACQAWATWCDTLFSTPAPAQDAWQRERLEYAFSVAARVSEDAVGERTLSAAEYFEGRLDWHAFDVNAEVTLGATADRPGASVVRTVIPAPVSYRGMPAAPWSMFQLSPTAAREAPRGRPLANLFFLPPSVAQTVEGVTLEELLLLRDEMANMAWAIERRIESPLEAALERAGDEIDSAAPAATPADAAPLYRLASVIPPHWVPLLPMRVDAEGREVRLARAATLAPDGSRRLVRAEGRLLIDPAAPNAPLLIHEVEVPREGARVRRTYQSARWLDGRLVVWAGHRKNVGRGEGSSGLAFDAIVE